MEACMMKPEVKKKPKPPKPPPKPVEIKRNDPEKPALVVPARPTDAELSQTQYRMKRATNNQTNENVTQKEKTLETPAVPPRPTEKELNTATRYSQRRRVEDTESSKDIEAELPGDEPDFKQSGLVGMFHRSQKEKTPTFTSYVINSSDTEGKTDDILVKQAPSSKPSVLKGVMKGLQFKSSPKASREPSPDPSAEEAGSEKKKSTEGYKLERNAETKQDKGGLLTGMFRKTPKERSSSPAVEVSKADSDTEEEEEEEDEEKTSDDPKEKGGFFSSILKKPNKPADETQENLKAHTELSASSESLSEVNNKEKGFFSGILRKSPKIPREGTPAEDKDLLQTELSASSESLSENTKEKGNVFASMFKKSPKLSEGPKLEEGTEPLHGELSASSDSLSENKEKGSLFSGLLRKTPKTAGEGNLSAHKDVSGSSDSLSEAASTKEKGGVFSGIFKKSPKPTDSFPSEEDVTADTELSNEASSDNKQEKVGGLFSGLIKKSPKAAGEKTDILDKEAQRELSVSNDALSDSNSTKEKNIFSNMFKKQTPAEGAAAEKDSEVNTEHQINGSSENLMETTVQKEKKGGLAGIFKRSASIENLFDEEKGGLFGGLKKKTPKASGGGEAAEDKDSQKELFSSDESLPENNNNNTKVENSTEKNIFSGIFKKTQKPADEDSITAEDKKLSNSCENLSESNTLKEKTGGLAGIFRKSPKPAPRSIATQDPLSDSQELSASWDNLTETREREDLSASNDDLPEATSTAKEKKVGFAGMFRWTPRTVEQQQESEDMKPPQGGGLRRKRTIKKKRRVVSFRVKKTLPRIPKMNQSQSSDNMPIIEETVELQELSPAQESTVEMQPVEMAAYPSEDEPAPAEQESDELIEWWNTVKGWTEWNETSNFQVEDEEMVVEQAADRVYMAARLFVRLFNQRGASLQHRILELVALADAADQFHKKTVTAAVGGGVASVAGSVATITGLILAPFTFGASIIVTAVGIGVATAGSITSATANITDTVHSNMDRKKVEKMIQGYQEEIKDIRECLEFVQEGMDTLQEWDFEKYSQSAAKKALNHNIKHVMKEGGRAGKALMINTDKLISTVQVLGAAGGAAKAAQAISVTTGVMSALFLALDVFFLAKDSHELRKGAKTKFAGKIRQVCKDLQDGLLELNKVKTQLQKTMDGIEVEEYEEIEEVEVEVEDDFESDPKKLAELEQELDLMEEKLDKKVEEEKKKIEEVEKEKIKEKKEETDIKEKEEPEEKKEREEVEDNDVKEEKDKGESKIPDEKKKIKSVKTAKEEALKEQKGSKKDKETENRITARKEKHESPQDKLKEDTGTNKTTDGKEKEKNKEEIKSRSGDSKRDNKDNRSLKSHSERGKNERESQRSQRSRRDEERGNPEQKSANNQAESRSVRKHSSRSERHGEQGGKHETRKTNEEPGSDKRQESWRREEEERGVKDWRAEMKSKEKMRESKDIRKESHRGQEASTGRESGSSREESVRSHHRRGHDDRGGSRVESARRKFERAGGEEEKQESRVRRSEDGASRRRGRERKASDREHEQSRRGSRAHTTALLEDGLYI